MSLDKAIEHGKEKRKPYYPFMHPEDWRPEGAMKIRVWGNGHVYIYDYNTKKLYEVGELE